MRRTHFNLYLLCQSNQSANRFIITLLVQFIRFALSSNVLFVGGDGAGAGAVIDFVTFYFGQICTKFVYLWNNRIVIVWILTISSRMVVVATTQSNLLLMYNAVLLLFTFEYREVNSIFRMEFIFDWK